MLEVSDDSCVYVMGEDIDADAEECNDADCETSEDCEPAATEFKGFFVVMEGFIGGGRSFSGYWRADSILFSFNLIPVEEEVEEGEYIVPME